MHIPGGCTLDAWLYSGCQLLNAMIYGYCPVCLCADLSEDGDNTASPLGPEPGDQFLWDLLASRADLVLVTGDKLLLQNEAMQPRVILTQTFVTQLRH